MYIHVHACGNVYRASGVKSIPYMYIYTYSWTSCPSVSSSIGQEVCGDRRSLGTGGPWGQEVRGDRRSVGTGGPWGQEVRGDRRSVGTGGPWGQEVLGMDGRTD